MNVVNVFLPTMKGTKLSFMRDVLADKKLHLKQNEVIRLDIPAYQELSVKNLYEDAMLDPVLAKYLPTKEQLSNKIIAHTKQLGLFQAELDDTVGKLAEGDKADIVSDCQAVVSGVHHPDHVRLGYRNPMGGFWADIGEKVSRVTKVKAHLSRSAADLISERSVPRREPEAQGL